MVGVLENSFRYTINQQLADHRIAPFISRPYFHTIPPRSQTARMIKAPVDLCALFSPGETRF
jgi:hypothetical protein